MAKDAEQTDLEKIETLLRETFRGNGFPKGYEEDPRKLAKWMTLELRKCGYECVESKEAGLLKFKRSKKDAFSVDASKWRRGLVSARPGSRAVEAIDVLGGVARVPKAPVKAIDPEGPAKEKPAQKFEPQRPEQSKTTSKRDPHVTVETKTPGKAPDKELNKSPATVAVDEWTAENIRTLTKLMEGTEPGASGLERGIAGFIQDASKGDFEGIEKLSALMGEDYPLHSIVKKGFSLPETHPHSGKSLRGDFFNAVVEGSHPLLSGPEARAAKKFFAEAGKDNPREALLGEINKAENRAVTIAVFAALSKNLRGFKDLALASKDARLQRTLYCENRNVGVEELLDNASKLHPSAVQQGGRPDAAVYHALLKRKGQKTGLTQKERDRVLWAGEKGWLPERCTGKDCVGPQEQELLNAYNAWLKGSQARLRATDQSNAALKGIALRPEESGGLLSTNQKAPAGSKITRYTKSIAKALGFDGDRPQSVRSTTPAIEPAGPAQRMNAPKVAPREKLEEQAPFDSGALSILERLETRQREIIAEEKRQAIEIEKEFPRVEEKELLGAGLDR